MPEPPGCAKLSIVIPAFDEQDNIQPLVDEIQREIVDRGIEAEVLFVDDGSRDGTMNVLRRVVLERPWVRVLHFPENRGKSAALAAGFCAARAPLSATLDADLQNDPADLRMMLEQFSGSDVALVQGDRSANRQDGAHRKLASAIGRFVRFVLLGDRVRDTGCATRMLWTDLARKLPLQFRGMHRFVPACIQMVGGRIVELPVRHRRRLSGSSKYGLGFRRGVPGLADTLAVRWMLRRWQPSEAVEYARPVANPTASPSATVAGVPTDGISK
jgi:dolichol-phosphate mannosyltransferase